MAIHPYRKRPAVPRLAILLEGGEDCLTEDGNVLPLADLPKVFRVWADAEMVNELWGDGVGEALCWQNRPVRWRATQGGEWNHDHRDVRLMRVAFPDDDADAMAGFIKWRAWLVKHGGAPQGSLGSTAWSLLRATLHNTLYTSVGQTPPIPFIMGGRQCLVIGKVGRHEPGFHYDLPAAYAAQLGKMRYGGAWAQVGHSYPYMLTSARGVLCFIRARVKVPSDIPFGPLPKRPARAPRGTDALIGFHAITYPVGRVLQGLWTWEELMAASDYGCKVKVLEIWILASGDGNYPFLPWWEAVQDGRTMGGFAGTLAKATGNAMWGQFAITPDAEKYVIRWSGSRSNPVRHKRLVPLGGNSPHYAPDLAETLTGRVRADLYRAMMKAGSSMMCAHTDGMWTDKRMGELGGTWRPKWTAARVDMVTPQFLRFYPSKKSEPVYVVAGAPDTLAPALFEKVWGSLHREGRVPA